METRCESCGMWYEGIYCPACMEQIIVQESFCSVCHNPTCEFSGEEVIQDGN